MQTEGPTEASAEERLLEQAGKAGLWLPALEVLAWAVFFVLACVFLTLRYWILPNIERYRGDIVALLSREIGLEVKIGALNVDWQGLRPELIITNVRIYDKHGREALVLPSVDNVIGWSSLLHLDLRLYSLRIEGPRLSVRRDPQGAISIAGIELSGQSGGGGFAGWLFEQREVEVRNAEIQWIDEKRGAPPLALSSLSLRLRNIGAQHQIGFTARPPKALGTGLDARALVTGTKLGEPASWSGEVYVDLGATDLAGWRTWVDYPIDLRQGKGALRLWATFGRGELQHATADVALSQVVVRFAKDLPVFELRSVTGRLHGGTTLHGYQFGVRDLTLVPGSGEALRPITFEALWEPAVSPRPGGTVAESRPAHGSVSANLIQLGPLARFAEFLPLPVDLRRLLAQLEPQGEVRDLRFEWNGGVPDYAAYSGRARFTQVAMRPWRAVPGFAGLSGSVSINAGQGTLYLDSHDAVLDLPQVFPAPRLPLESLSGRIDWQRQGPGAVLVRVADLSFANLQAAGSAFGTYRHTDGQGPGVIDLSAHLVRADGRYTERYLPLAGIMGAEARDWIAKSIRAGRASDVSLRLSGDLRDFPFINPASGQFDVTAHVTGAVLDYAPGWPRIENIDGELQFDRDSMLITGRSGTIAGVALSQVRVSIPSFSGATRVLVSGQADGSTDAFLKFTQRSPVRSMIERITDGMSATGPGHLQLKLDLPLDNLDKSKIAGQFEVSKNALRLRPGMPPIEDLIGTVSFTESSLALHGLNGQLLGGPIAFGGGAKRDAGVAVSARGEATVAGLRRAFANPWWQHLSGRMPYVASVKVGDSGAQVSIESSLAGVASDLPPPLAKAAGEALPLRIEYLPGSNDSSDRISVSLGTLLRAELLRAGEGNAMVLQRASVALNPAKGEAVRLPERKATLVYGSLPAFDLDRWLPLFGGSEPAGAISFDLRLGQLDAFGKRMHDVTLQGGADSSGWSANVEAREMAGVLSFSNHGAGKLVARLKRFQIPGDVPGGKPQKAVKELPAVDLVTEEFSFRGKEFGRVEVGAEHEGADWRIDKLAMTNPDATLSAHGLWRTAPPGNTSLEFKLEAKDVGKFLGRIGYPNYIKGGTATLSGGASWRGDPLSIDYPSLSGKLKLSAKSGQFLEIDPGVGKLITLVNLQALPHFRELFSKGLQFDKISGSLQVESGVMTTSDFKMDSLAADVGMSGDVNLVKETQNLLVNVTPKLTGSTSTVLALLNPLAGVTTAIAQSVLKNPLGQIFAFKYSVTGTWAEPKVKKLEEPSVAPSENEFAK
jgi:uncharacterized protein (TIGR02099 family)